MSTVSASHPATTVMTPGWASAADCMASPRSATSRTPSSKPRAPLTARALYSPREWPATLGRLDAQPLDGVGDEQAEGEGGQLGVSGLGQLVEGGIEQEVADVSAGGLRGVVDDLPRRMVDPGTAHPRPLRPLAGE